MFCTLHECGWKKSDFDRHDECGYSRDATNWSWCDNCGCLLAMLPDWDLIRMANHGDAWFGVFHSSGDYHKAQEGSRMNGLKFFAERYTENCS